MPFRESGAQRLQHRFLGGETGGIVGGPVGGAVAVGALFGGEHLLRKRGGALQNGLHAGHFHHVHPQPHRIGGHLYGSGLGQGFFQLLASHVYSTVTDLAKFRGWSTSQPRSRAMQRANICSGTLAVMGENASRTFGM